MKLVPLDSLQGIGGVLCHGCFDGLHFGHLSLFKAAAKMGYLTVTLTAGAFLTHRQPGQPVFSDDERAEFIAELECVRKVAMVYDATALPAIGIIQPAIYVKAVEIRRDGDETLNMEMSLVRSCGGRTEFIPKLPPYYSSSTLLSGAFLWAKEERARKLA